MCRGKFDNGLGDKNVSIGVGAGAGAGDNIIELLSAVALGQCVPLLQTIHSRILFILVKQIF